MDRTTDEQTIKLKWKVFLPLAGFLIIVSNTFTAYSYQIEENETELRYERERTDRKLKSQLIETKQLLHIQSLENEIIMLELKLQEALD